MKSFLISISLLLLTSVALADFTSDPCSSLSVQPNSYLLYVNYQNQSDRSDLINTLKALAGPGFKVNWISGSDVKVPWVLLYLTFDKGWWNDQHAAEVAKLQTLNAVANIKGNRLECNPINEPF